MTASSANIDLDISTSPSSSGVNYHDGMYSYLKENIMVTIKVENEKTEVTRFKKLIYTPKSTGIGKIMHHGVDTNIPGSSPSVITFYWVGDSSYKMPLIILRGTDQILYTHKTAKSGWSKDIIPLKMIHKALEQQNCVMNRAHQIEFADRDSGVSICNSCSNRFIIQHNEPHGSGYKRYKFTPQAPSNFQYFYFTNSYAFQEGLPYLKNPSSVNVFWPTGASQPILIHYPYGGTNIWYKRRTGVTNGWEKIPWKSLGNIGENNVATISKLINGTYHPQVTIMIDQKKGPSYSSEEIVQLKVGTEEGFPKYIHAVNGMFVIKSIMNGQSTLVVSGELPKGPLENLTVFYSSEGSTGTPLLIELNGARNVYYAKVDGWEVLQHPGKLAGQSLRRRLEELKKKHTDAIPGSSTTEEMAKSSSTSPSSLSAGTIAGIVVGCLAGICLIGIATWKMTPVIKSYVARRHSSL